MPQVNQESINETSMFKPRRVPSVRSQTRTEPPLVIRHTRQDERRDGHFTPAAVVAITPHLRTSGLLASLPGEEVKSLLAVLTCITANGRIEPSLPEVAGALNVSESTARERLLRLQTFLWQGEPLLHSRQRELGLDVYAPAPGLIARQEEETAEPPVAVEPVRVAAHRDAIIAHSRENYARPRAEVERIIAEQMGHHKEEDVDTPEGSARRRLRALGVPTEFVEQIIQQHPLAVIEEQLDWLGHRHAKNPARLILAAIENRYEPPARVRLERAIAADESVQPAERLAEGGEVRLSVPPLSPEGGDHAS